MRERLLAKFECDSCGFSKDAPDEWIGKAAVCPKCKQHSRVAEDVVTLADENEFNEQLTFAYKGDYLGMTLDSFLLRHDDPESDEFRLISSDKCDRDEFKAFEFESWMKNSERLLQIAAVGTRLTIVGFTLKNALFTFFDRRLSTIALIIENACDETYIDILPELYSALNDEAENSEAAEIQITKWKRPLGTMSLVYIPYEPAINVRYVNVEMLGEFNRLRTQLTASRDL